jgi:type I restriction enzyme M protein
MSKNERKTENLFRKFILQDLLFLEKKITIEEQSSDNIKIDKLLKNASKGGNGKGYPEFIIQFKENPDFIIVVECKADSKFHVSETKDKYKDYAVDGALLYSSFLSKEFDVLSIAISGESENSLKVSHFLQLKGTDRYHSIFKEDSFLPLEDYLNGYQTDERKFNQDFQELLKYSKTLNDKFHTLKIKERLRSLLISGALIALEDKAFFNSYKYQKPKELAENLVNTIKNKLNEVQSKYGEDIVNTYSFIKTNDVLSKEENVLRDLITEIDTRINNFIKTYKYFDTLGQFYIEFLRYANNDKGLGIVLTPPHITELFSEIANVNKESIVLDTCTGTGGFLISAMKQMVIDAGGDKEKELNIKSKQIVGIDRDDEIFIMLSSNMYIHGDGRSNLIKGSCFDEKIIEEVKKYKPNVGFLNPPYSATKNDIPELEFVLNNLSMLEKGSYCVAIIPLSCVLATTGKEYELKEKLLKEHTLEAVFTMPTELFNNSKVTVTTCIIVCRAKEKHPDNYKTYFAYWKEDGFTKRKASGRADYYHKWSVIKKYWIDNYRNRDDIPGHSVKKYVTAKDEWCVEVYMETNYNDLNNHYFEKIIVNYLSYLLVYFKIPNISSKPTLEKNIDLNTKNWGTVELSSIFKVESGKGGNIYDLEIGSEYPYISSTSVNNGLIDFVNADESDLHDENTITINRTGSVGETFYQNHKYIASRDRVRVLIPKFKMNEYIAMFLIGIISLEKYRFNYGRTWGTSRIKESKIKLPTDKNGNPDWQFMQDYIKSLPYSSNL